MKQKQSLKIIYVNFAPYENAGKILDFLKDRFEMVAVFSFSFHRLKNKKDANLLSVYLKNQAIARWRLFDFHFPERFVFLFLPIRVTIIFIQLIFYIILLNFKYGRFKLFFSVNAFTAWSGNVCKKIGLIDKTIFWVWDYYPPHSHDLIISLVRKVYWLFDKWATKSDRVVYLNKRIADLRRNIGEISAINSNSIIPIGTETNKYIKKYNKSGKRLSIAFLGVIKKSQGLDILFNKNNKLKKVLEKVDLHIIGDGPDYIYYYNKAKSSKLNATFYGYLEDIEVSQILQKADIGLACYAPSRNNVSYYGDPSKIKMYLSYGVPVITTNVFEFSEEIKSSGAGVVVNYSRPGSLALAIKLLSRNRKKYRRNAYNLSKKYNYRKLYEKIFIY